MPWTDADLEKQLAAERVVFEILRTKEDTPTVESAARALDVPEDAIVKSVLFVDRASGAPRYALVLARGLSRIDKDKLAKHAGGGDWRLASPEECVKVTGYGAGTVPPVGHATPVKVVMDRRVHAMPEIIGGGGTHRASLRIARKDVEHLTRCEVHDVAHDPVPRVTLGE